MSVDFGSKLQDQLPALFDSLEVLHSHLHDISHYYSGQAEIERAVVQQHKALLKKTQERRSKRVEALVAGASPVQPFKDGDEAGRRHTLDSAWARMLSSGSEVCSAHERQADSLDVLASSIRTAMERSSALLKSHQSWYTNYLVAEKDRMDAERAKRKEKYDSSCSDLESARQKQDRDPDKGDKAFNRAKAEMECAKDAYLASIQACNRSSATFFARDLPQMHRQYQTLWTLIVSSLSNFLRQGCGMTDTHLEKLKEINGRALDAVNKIEPATDQAIYVEMNARAFFPPPDKAFEPCALWHDDPKVVLSETGKSFLQNMAATSQKHLDTPTVLEGKEKEVETLGNIVDTYSRKPALGNAVEVAENMLNAYRQAMELRIPRETSESNYDFCFDSLDGDLGSQRPHDFKTASYPKSHSCVVCHDSIWGIKGGMKCRSCPAEVHIKCAAFIPANCTGAKQMQARPRSTSSASSFMMSPTNTPSPSHTSFLSRADTTASRATTVIPEASSSSTSLQSNTTSPPRTMVFDFQASTELELSVTSGQAVAVLEPDTQGWTKVRDVKSGQEGLVPTSYISSDSVSAPTPNGSSQVPIKIAYDASEAGEVSVQPGDQVRLLDGAPEGWTMVETSAGKKGLVPAWAVE